MTGQFPILPLEANHSNPSDPWFLGIDLGTGSCKSVVITETGNITGFGAYDYPASTTQSKWEEQHTQVLLAGLLESVRAAVAQAGVAPASCAGLSLGGALHSLIAVDANRQPLTGLITWADGRGAAQARAIRSTPFSNELYQATGCPTHGMFPLYKIAWLREERPEIFRQAARFLSAKEFVLQALTGAEYLVDYSIAAGSGLLNTHTLAWNSASLDFAGIRASQLSPLAGPAERLPGLTAAWAARLGLPAAVPIYLGSSDAVNSSLGAGAVLPGQTTCMVGTSGAFRQIVPHPILDLAMRTWCYAIDPTHWLVGGAINNGGIALSWLKDMLNGAFAGQPISPALSFNDLISMAAAIPPGAEGLICLPFFAGERSPNWNPDSRAVFFGLKVHHHAGHLARALLEGVAFRMRSLKDPLEEIAGSPAEIHASGGFTHSPVWPQIIASVLNQELVVPTWGETSSLGSAFWALLGAGRISSIEEISPMVTYAGAYQPLRQQVDLYEQHYRLFKNLYTALEPSFAALAALDQTNHPQKTRPNSKT